jgi:hypothetical protein
MSTEVKLYLTLRIHTEDAEEAQNTFTRAIDDLYNYMDNHSDYPYEVKNEYRS